MSQFVSAADGDAAKGKPIFQGKCVICHEPQGEGDGPIGQKL
jgi:cytochrome c